METLLYWFGAWAALCGGFWVIFERIETVSTTEWKNKVAKLFTLHYGEAISEWPDTFIRGFDYIFCKKHFTFRRFWRSSVASVSCVIILSLVWPRETGFYRFADMSASGLSGLFLAGMGVCSRAVLLNVFPDYFSLGESRYLLRLLRSWIECCSLRVASVYTMIFVIVDLILTFIIFFVSLAVLSFTLNLVTGFGVNENILITLAFVKVFTDAAVDPFTYDPSETIAMAIFVYTTFSTSVWIWLYTLSVMGVKIALPVIDRFEKLKKLFDYQSKPFRTIGLFTNLIITVIFIAAGIVKIVKVIAS